MKFQKFVKSIGSEGIIYERKNGERWLASDNVFMRIPEDIRSITASEIAPMPEAIENIINYESFTDPCELHKAVMPYADGAIKDCVRIFATENALNTIAICNSAYALIERKDFVEMYAKFNVEDETSEAKALVIKEQTTPLPEDEPEVIGLIFPTEYEEDANNGK